MARSLNGADSIKRVLSFLSWKSGTARACRRDAPPGFRATPRVVFAVTAIRLQFLTPEALRASLASRGSAQSPSPPRAAWRPSNTAEPASPDRPGQCPAALGRAWRIRRGLLRQVVRMRVVLNAGGSSPQRHDRRFTDTPPSLAMEFPHHASSMPPQDAAGSFALSVGIIDFTRIKGQASAAVQWECRAGPVSLRGGRPMRPWLVVNPGGGTAAPRASWPQPSGANNFPCAVTAFGAFLAGQILCASRSSTAFRPQAMRPAHPPPDGSQQGRDGRDLG